MSANYHSSFSGHAAPRRTPVLAAIVVTQPVSCVLPRNTLSIVANGHIRIDATEEAYFINMKKRNTESFNISTTWLPRTLEKPTER